MTDSIRFITGRLLLRSLKMDDAMELFAYRSDHAINRYQGWIPESMRDVHDFIEHGISSRINIPGTWYQLAIIKKETGELIGDIGVHFPDKEEYQAEIGFTLDKREHGRGYATEAVKATINYLFNDLDKHRIFASIDPANERSIALVERLGFRKEAHFRQSIFIRGQWADNLIYAILKEEWINKWSHNPE